MQKVHYSYQNLMNQNTLHTQMGIDLFEENIVHVMPYSDALIVFTSTKLWRLDMLTDGLSWSKTLLQQNLRIIDKDIPILQY